MRRIKLLILLCVAGLQLSLPAAAQGPKRPELKRRASEAAPPERRNGWERGRRRDAERSAGRPAEGRAAESRPTEREKRPASKRGVDRESRWRRSQPERVREPRPTQRREFIEHVFHGHVNARNRATGFHYEGAQMQAANGTKVVEGTRTAPDSRGVYEAKVMVRGVEKAQRSSFFPRSWNRADVMKAINEAHANRRAPDPRRPNYFEGRSSSGVTVGMYCNKHGEPITAYPIYRKD